MSMTRVVLAVSFCTLAVIVGGCSAPPPPEPESSTQSTSEAPTAEESETATESGSEEKEQPEADPVAEELATDEQTAEEQAADSEAEMASPEEAATNEGSSDTSDQASGQSGQGAGRSRSGSSGSSGATGAKAEDLTAANADEAARLAEQHLSRSEGESDVAKAYRDASIALHYARQFPGDARCLGLLDAARGRLQTLEGQTESASLRRRSGTLPEKVIVEKP